MYNDSCVFCKIAKKQIPSKIAFEDSDAVVFEDLKPQAPVHLLIIPKKHIEKLNDLSDKDSQLMGKLLMLAKNIAREKNIAASGYRVVLNCNKDAGQEVFHIHLHLLGGRKFTWPPG